MECTLFWSSNYGKIYHPTLEKIWVRCPRPFAAAVGCSTASAPTGGGPVACLLTFGSAFVSSAWVAVEALESAIKNCGKCIGMEDEVARMQNEIDDLKERIEQMEDLMQDVIPGGD